MAEIVCFTGHRAIPTAHYAPLCDLLTWEIRRLAASGATEFRTGGALGFDTMAALSVLSLKKEISHIRLSLMLPYPEQADAWSENDRCLYEQIRSLADSVRYTAPHYFAGALQMRNRALIAGSDICVAYLRTSHGGGAAYTSALALRSGLELINLADALPQNT